MLSLWPFFDTKGDTKTDTILLIIIKGGIFFLGAYAINTYLLARLYMP